MPADTARWEHFEHRADIGVAGYGATISEAFEQAALGMSAVVCDPATVDPAERVEIDCEDPDPELLLVDWLNALIFEMATRRMLFSGYRVHLDGARLLGEAWGEAVDPERHQPAVEVKGATYTELAVRQLPSGGWLARCVLDV